MKTVNNYAAQGDFILIAVNEVPDNVKRQNAIDGQCIIAHSETGHNHVCEATRAEVYESADDEFVAYIRSLGDGAQIEHKRGFDTHETIELPPNRIYQIRRQREYVPEGFRRAAD